MQNIFNLKQEKNIYKKLLSTEDKLDVIYILDMQNPENFDGSVVVEHTGADTESNILIKILLGQGSSVKLTALVKINPGAKRSCTRLDVKALMLDEYATIECTPGVEIQENEINGAGHGLTIGSIDKEQLFYLTSRGIDKKTAKELIVSAFLG
jgi:Fe-S cluster assembly protein SufD